MAGNSSFEMVSNTGRLGGLRNLLRADFGKWFRTNQWWVQSLVWTAVICGITSGIMFSGTADSTVATGIMMYIIFSALFPAIAVVIILQDAIVGERETGTAAWVLSKPVSRTSFVLSKLIPNLVGVLVTMILIPSAVAYILFWIKGGQPLDPGRFILVVLLLWLYSSYYLSLTLMLGTLFSHRAPVIGIPLALAFGQQMLFGIAPVLMKFLPWTIAMPAGDSENSIISAIMLNAQLPNLTPLYVTIACTLIFIAVAVWKFEQEQF
jgi:ABC-2 type transport system permease protein